jgi:hypothetical protein
MQKITRLLGVGLVTALALCSIGGGSAHASEGDFPYVWTQYGPQGSRIVRVILDEGQACPVIRTGNDVIQMTKRTSANPQNFPVTVCSERISDTTEAATVLGEPLPPLPSAVNRIAVVGDTGCRMASGWYQDCNDPDNPSNTGGWPFARMAKLIDAANKDVLVHVGDYHYRESPCPEGKAECAGAVSGDNWVSWLQDWFDPAKPMLGDAPWVLLRGNHENCARAGEGWFLFMGHGPDDQATQACAVYTDGYVTPVGADLEFVVMDSAQREKAVIDPKACEAWTKQTTTILDGAPGAGLTRWALTHEPIYTWYASGDNASVTSDPCITGTFRPAEFARGYARDKANGTSGGVNYPLVLSGDVHTWQWTKPKQDGLPVQITAGHGATDLETLNYWGPLTAWPVGTHTDRAPYAEGGWWSMEVVFGYALMSRAGSDAANWRVDMIDINDALQQVCQVGDSAAAAAEITKAAGLPPGSETKLLTGGCVNTGS